MNYSDEIAKLAKLAALQRENGKTDPVTEELIEGLLTVVKELSSDLAEMNERLRQNEEFTETLSDDLFDIQSLAANGVGSDGADSDLSGLDLAQLFARMNGGEGEEEPDRSGYGDEDEDDDGDSSFVRCPFCNTLIFGDPSANKFSCPFCGNSFTNEDI